MNFKFLMMKKYITAFLVLNFLLTGFGQTSNKLEKEFYDLREKTEKTGLVSPDSAKVLNDKLMELAIKSKSDQFIANALTTKLRVDVFCEDALEINKKALKINLKLKNSKEIATNYTLYGLIYLYKADYINSMKYFNKSLEISLPNKYYSLTKQNYRTIGALYNLQNDFQKAFKNVQEALKIEKLQPDNREKASAISILATHYAYKGDKVNADKYYQEAYNLFKSINNEYRMAITLLDWSIIYEESNLIKSLEMELEAQILFDKIVPNNLYSANNLGNIGGGYLLIAKSDSLIANISNSKIPKSKISLLNLSEIYISRSFEILKTNKNAYGLFFMSGTLSELQAYKGDYKNAYANLLESKKLGDSLFSQKNKNAIAKLESEKEVFELKVKNEKKATLNKILIGASIGLLLIGYLGYRNFRNKQKLQNIKITELEKDKQLFAIDAMLKVQEDERSRIAKDLHDGLGGLLSGTKLSFNTMKESLILTPENATQFEKSLSMLDTTIADLRKVAHNLMPEALVKYGLNDALRDFCNTIQSSTSIIVNYQKLGIDRKINNTAETFIYRIAQELVNNAVKHADAKEIMVQITTEKNKVLLAVEDDGKGYDTSSELFKKGDGLDNITYRVQYLNGKIDTVSTPENGTSINIELNV